MTPITAALRELAAKATPVTDGCDDDPKHLHLVLSPFTLNWLLDVVEAAEALVAADWTDDVGGCSVCSAVPDRYALLIHRPDCAWVKAGRTLAALEADHAV